MPTSPTETTAQALLINPSDNVAVVTIPGAAGQPLLVRRQGGADTLLLRSEAAFGHKIAITDIAKGAAVRKYGWPIGLAGADIAAGDHVHIHNIVGLNADLRG